MKERLNSSRNLVNLFLRQGEYSLPLWPLPTQVLRPLSTFNTCTKLYAWSLSSPTWNACSRIQSWRIWGTGHVPLLGFYGKGFTGFSIPLACFWCYSVAVGDTFSSFVYNIVILYSPTHRDQCRLPLDNQLPLFNRGWKHTWLLGSFQKIPYPRPTSN